MRPWGGNHRAQLMCGAACVSFMLAAAPASARADSIDFNIPPQSLSAALDTFAAQSRQPILVTPDMTANKLSQGVTGTAGTGEALAQLLTGTGLTYKVAGKTFLIVRAGEGGGPQSGSATGGGAEVEALIVTAQKREENIQDVPIAMSAFSQEDLTRSQVAGGPDLMTQVPNMTFTKTNFSSYSIQIRGIGTQAISATTDAAVAVAFNNTPFIRNRFFEQEFYDLQRVEVLRGPQGTLYGRNATAGVVNIISAKPTFGFESRLSGDISNYSSKRLEGMVNMPLVEDKVALRVAGAWTKRDGFVTNQITGNPIDGRDLWSTRLSLRFAPTDQIEANLIWEHFEEDDDRLRSAKQLCKTHEVTNVAGFETTHYQTLPEGGQALLFAGVQGSFSQGCTPESLYSPDSFQTPNGISLPYYLPLQAIFLPTALQDPYVNRTQSHDLRVIESTIDPEYRANSDLTEFQVNVDISDNLTLTSETAYLADTLFSLEDYNRFNTAPGAWRQTTSTFPDRTGILTPGEFGGVFCDPQLGCTDRLVAVDVSSAKSRQFSQEFRLSSDYDGAFNFSLGANFLRYDTEDKYYVFINSLSLIAALSPQAHIFKPYVVGDDNHECLWYGPTPPNPSVIQNVNNCTYLDPNPIGSLNDQGHNYFLSRNPYKLISYAVFGEAYYNITDTLKITGGLRWTVDKKEAPRIPSWVLADQSVGYPITDVTEQEWREPTGRVTLDWKPDLAFTDETLLYASLAHGYKAGGANPPPTGPVIYGGGPGLGEAVVAKSATHPKTFEPEFVNALEVGTKNTLLDGTVTLNLSGFYYNYTGYQISQIVNRSAVNLNFDAKIWGLEIEADWRPVENLRLGFKGGYENTRVGDGMKAVDLMDRTAGHDDWIVVKPFPTFPSNCILPVELFVGELGGVEQLVNLGGKGGGNIGGCEMAYVLGLDPVTNKPYVPNPTDTSGSLNLLQWHPGYAGFDPSTAPNNGEGFYKDLSGNKLPNAPTFTATITADYTVPLPSEWLMTLHTDLYYQSEAWTRIFNMEGYDKLKAYSNINLAAIFTNEEAGWKIMAYVKNVLDRDSITGSFLNSDDTGLTTNVFLTEPRLYGIRITKDWTGGAWFGDGSGHPAGQPYPFTLELAGQAQRHDAPYDPVTPSFNDSFSAVLRPAVADAQNRDLDWGDGREVKLTYTPNGGLWHVSAGWMTGQVNGGAHRFLATELGGRGCLFSAPCPEESNFRELTNYSSGSVIDQEEHQVIDFSVGRDLGIGIPGIQSRLTAGLRYGEFESRTHLDTVGIPDWDVPATYAWFGNSSQHHLYEADLLSTREFEGWGPTLSWEASKHLLGDEAAGHVDLDWKLEGGVLFGKQRTSATGSEQAEYFDGPVYYNYHFTRQVGDTLITPPEPGVRSQSVTVPSFAASVGLSYEIQRVKLSGGYRWERYFNVLDAGWSEHEDADRTIDGPYFKIAVGFGG